MAPMKVSPFRLVDCKASHYTYKGIEASVSPSSHNIACSSQCVAVSHMPNDIMVLPLDMMGNTKSAPRLQGHSDTVTDLAFNPFDPNVLASCAKDGVVNVRLSFSVWRPSLLTSTHFYLLSHIVGNGGTPLSRACHYLDF